MTTSTWFGLALVAAIGACGSSNHTPSPDAAPVTVMSVACPGTPAATITTSDLTAAYSPPSTTITVGQVVQFTMSSTHNLVPDATASDAGLNVGFGATKCLMFTHTGTFNFHCSVHLFKGVVTVQ